MRIQVTGQRLDVGGALQAHVGEALEAATAKYAGRPTDASVVFRRDGHQFACELVIHLSTGLTAQANGAGADCYAAFDQGLDRMAKQLRRHKRRLKDHHLRAQPVATMAAMSSILAPFADDAGDEDMLEGLDPPDGTEAAALGLDAPAGTPPDGAPDDLGAPLVIAETELRLPTLTVAEAVMQMDLAHAPVLVFRNHGSGALNVVYRREDGNIGWIDPRPEGGNTSRPEGGNASRPESGNASRPEGGDPSRPDAAAAPAPDGGAAARA